MSARARGPGRRGRAPPRCGVQGEAGTAGPGAREQWRSRRGRGGSGPPAPGLRRPRRLALRPGQPGPACPSDLPLPAAALLSPRLPPPSNPLRSPCLPRLPPTLRLQPLCSQFYASAFSLPPLSNALLPPTSPLDSAVLLGPFRIPEFWTPTFRFVTRLPPPIPLSAPWVRPLCPVPLRCCTPRSCPSRTCGSTSSVIHPRPCSSWHYCPQVFSLGLIPRPSWALLPTDKTCRLLPAPLPMGYPWTLTPADLDAVPCPLLDSNAPCSPPPLRSYSIFCHSDPCLSSRPFCLPTLPLVQSKILRCPPACLLSDLAFLEAASTPFSDPAALSFLRPFSLTQPRRSLTPCSPRLRFLLSATSLLALFGAVALICSRFLCPVSPSFLLC